MSKQFKAGSGCFVCETCGKRTRDTNGDNGALGLCPKCYEAGVWGNTLSDSGFNDERDGGGLSPWAWLKKNCKTAKEVETLGWKKYDELEQRMLELMKS